MTELVAYRFKQIAADGYHVTAWTKWRSGRLRAEMMEELRDIGRDNLSIVQCCVPRAEIDETTLRENDIWQWTKHRGWYKTDLRNWFADSCDPTKPYGEDITEPFSHPLSIEQLDFWHRKLYGVEDLTSAITLSEMTDDDDSPANTVTGDVTDEYPSIHGGDIWESGFVRNKFIDSLPYSQEGTIG